MKQEPAGSVLGLLLMVSMAAAAALAPGLEDAFCPGHSSCRALCTSGTLQTGELPVV